MYSADVRKIATRLYFNYVSLRKVASIIGSSHSSIYRWLNYVPRQRKNRERKLGNPEVLDTMKLYIKTHPFCSVKDLRSVLFETFKIKVSNELVRLTINKTLYYTKKRARYFSEPKNDQEKLKEFLERRERFVQENRIFVSIDETSFGRNYLPSIGYSEKGRRLYAKRPFVRITTCSVLAAVSKENPIIFKKKQGSFETLSFCEFLKSLTYPAKTVILMKSVACMISSREAGKRIDKGEMLGLALYASLQSCV